MGEQKVSLIRDKRQVQNYTKMLLEDVAALEYMLDNDWFESDVTRIGAEQEMVLVDDYTYKPAPIAMQVLEDMKDIPWVESELARFNLEIGLDPLVFEGNCFSQVEMQISDRLNVISDFLAPYKTSHLLTGILPSIRKYDMEIHNLTPKKRYIALIEGIQAQNHGKEPELKLLGIDELLIRHQTPFIEACNTSFQVHLQVAPKDFVQYYNIAQAITAPIMAIAANSPIVFGKRLWHETRIAMFQQSLDTRSTQHHMRERRPRVSFGTGWIKDSILDIYREDIADFRALLIGDEQEHALEMIKAGITPNLRTLQVHNSTIYRWNRPCYGVSPNGKPHLRIENRVFPAGPTLLDEVANAALWLGAMKGYAAKIEDISKEISFIEVKDNFTKAARYGIDTTFSWLGDRKLSAVELLKNEIIPMAKFGLELMNVDPSDIVRYLSVIEGRCDAHMTGARWMLRNYSNMIEEVPRDEAISLLTANILKNQKQGIPVHQWDLPNMNELMEYRTLELKVDEFMSTDVLTARPEDSLELVADLMKWRKIRYLPIEDEENKLIGLISLRDVMETLLKLRLLNSKKQLSVRDFMQTNVITVDPEDNILHALKLLTKHKIGCLPVAKNNEIYGMITDVSFITITERLMERMHERYLKDENP